MTDYTTHFDPDIERRPLPRALRGWNALFSRLYHRVELLTPVPLPPRGPAILVCNHTSGLDPLLIQSCFDRLVVWMMAKEFYDLPALNWVFRAVQAIPVARSGRDLSATRAAIRALEAGRILGVFPEGRIETDDQLLPFQTGVAMMAIKTHVPIYPAYLDGTQRGKEMLPAFLTPNRATLAIGPAIDFDRTSTQREALEIATAIITKAVESLRHYTRQSLL